MDDLRPPSPREAAPSLPKVNPPAPPAGAPTTSPPKANLPLKKPRRRLKWLLIILVLVVALIAAGAVAASWWYNEALQPRSNTQERIKITVDAGETADAIGRELEQKGVIKSGFAFQWYVQQQEVLNDLKAGNYLLSPTQSVPEIVEWLVEGRVDNFNLTILPGQTIREIREDLIKDGFAQSEVDAALEKDYDHPLFKDKPADASLEGYIFPDTYEITSETTPEQLFERTFDTFYQNIEENDLISVLGKQGFTLYEGITLASLVELEVSKEKDRYQVAQVFEKRLKEGMPLGSDVSYLYGAELLEVEPSTTLDSPYNTRVNKGLPPGPIANFTIVSLEAVATPAPGDYLYFVSGDDGTTHFSKTEEEHQKNIDAYCTELCQRDY